MRCPVLSHTRCYQQHDEIGGERKQKWTTTRVAVPDSDWAVLPYLPSIIHEDMVEVLQHDIKTGWAHGKKARAEAESAVSWGRIPVT